MIADGTGVLAHCGVPAVGPLNNLYGIVYLLFMGASIAPLAASLLTEEGLVPAARAIFGQLLSGSPFFFVFQVKPLSMKPPKRRNHRIG